MSIAKDNPPLQKVWTPDGSAALRAMAEQFPAEIGQSSMLRLILDREGISL
jgi:hypothetical protein